MSSIGPYLLISPLGEGGMGTVWRAQHQATGEIVALKTVKVPQGNLLRSIRREIQALASLNHPGIVRIFEMGLHEGLPWYAMELLTGQTLRQWIQERPSEAELPTLPQLDASSQILVDTQPVRKASSRTLTEIIALVQRLCIPLAFLHGEGLVHRDLKPDNILIRADGSPVLVDFGLASQEGYGGDSSRETLAVEAGMSGTAQYMSPEQIQMEPLDARADLYALGVILYEMLTGQRPFTGKTPVAILFSHLEKEPKTPSSLRSTIPEELSSLVMGLLRKKREERRPGYAEDLACALEALTSAIPSLSKSDPAPHPPPKPYLYRPSLSGRSEPLTKLKEALPKLQQGAGGLWLISGESGVGKTRLVMEFAKEAARKGLRVLAGECQDQRVKLPLSAFLKLLQEIADTAREGGQPESERLLGRRGKVLSRYEPSLASLPGQELHPEPVELSLEAAKYRLFACLGETLFAFSREKPLLVVLDDLQWADELSLGFLNFFLRCEPLLQHVLILATYRSEEMTEELSAFCASPRVTNLRLDRLEEAAVGQIVGEMLALSPPPKAFSHFLSEQSEGNPFFVAEYLRTAVEEGLLSRDKQGLWQLGGSEALSEEHYAKLPLPRNLRALVSRRLSGLPIDAQHILEAAAVLGREAPRACLESMQGEVLEEQLRELIRRQIFEETTEGSLRFLHDKLREVAYERISTEDLPRLHRRAALALEQTNNTKEGELGHHWEQAKEPTRAQPLYLAGARKATKTYSYQEAEKLYRAYLRLCATPTIESTTARNELGEKILQVQGRMEEAAKEHQQALTEARSLGERSIEGESLRLFGVVCWQMGRVEEGIGLLERAISLLHEAGNQHQKGICLGNLATLYKEQGRLEEAQDLYTQALALHNETGNQYQKGICLGNLASLYNEQGRPEEAQDLFPKALSLLREIGSRRAESVFLGNLATLYKEQGYIEEALGLYIQVINLLREIGSRRFEGIYLGNLALLHKEQNRPEEAQSLYTKALALHREVGNPRSEGICLENLAVLHQEQGRLEEAQDLYTQALRLLHEVGDRRAEGACLGERAILELWRTGDLEKARTLFHQGEALLIEVGDKFELGKLLCDRGHLALAQGESAEGLLVRIQELTRTLKVKPESELGKKLARLERAQTAFLAKEHDRLFRGHLLEDIPKPLRAWLARKGHLPGS